MATREELSEQLAVTQKLAAAVESMARSMSRVESSFDNQISAVEKLTAAIQTLKGQDLGALNQVKLDTLQKEMKDTATGTMALTGRIKDLGTQMTKKFPAAAAVGAAALSGFIQGIRNVLALGKSVTGFFASFVDGAASIAASIIAIPFKMFNALVDMAAAAGGGMDELAQAIENLRKEMGDLKGPGTSAVIETTKTLKGFSDTGLSAWRVFGTLAERLEHVTKVAVAMGATFGKLTQEFRENGGALLAFQKGLGVSEEQMKAIGDRAIAMGKPMTKVFMDMTKQTLALGKAFDIDQKLIGKDMAKALQNVKHFGALTVKEIAQASVYARKLGVELDKIVGTLDAFETFDTAAENAAKLSQSFGITVDAFKLMDAQNPAEQIDMLRKSMQLAGVSTEKMTRQQLKLLAQTTGLSEETAKLAFSQANQGVSYDKIKKQSEAAEKKTLTQAEAMSKLADSIERMVKSGGAQEGGFWQMFVKGFLGGIQASKEFREIIWNIKRSLQLVYFEGVRLGKAFVDMFPGIKQFLSGIADFFNPAKFKKLVGGVVDILKEWMSDLGKPGGKASFPDLMKKLQKNFFDFFDMQKESGKQVLSGFKTIFKTISKILAEAIKWMADKTADGISFIIDLITGKKKLGALGAAGGGLGFLAEALAPLGDALTHAWKVLAPKLWELIKVLFDKVVEFLKRPEVTAKIKQAIPYIAAALFGPAMTRALVGALTASLAKSAIGALTGGGGKIVAMITGKTKEIAEKAAKVSPAAGAEGLKATAAAGKATDGAIKGAGGWGVKDAVKLGLKLVAIAGALAIGGIMLAKAIVEMKQVLESGGIKRPDDAAVPLMTLGAMVLAAVPLMFALKLAGQHKPTEIIKGVLAVAAAVGLGGMTMALALGATKDILDRFGMKSVKDIVPPLLVMGAVALGGIPLVFAMTLASKAGNVKDVLKGGLVVAAAAGIVGVTGAIIGGLLSLIDPGKLVAAGKFMVMMSFVFLAMVPLIFASMIIGALATGPQAIALAAAAVGMGVLGDAVAKMATIAVDIIKELNKMTIKKDFKTKIDVFLGVMQAIQAFADTLVKLIGLMTPSFTELLSGTATTFSEKVDATVKLIDRMVGKKGGGYGIIGVVETVVAAIKDLATYPGVGESAKIFSEVLTGVTGAVQAMTPPPEFYSAQTDFINILDPSIGRSLDQTMKGYMQVMQTQMTTIIGQITETVKTFSTLTVPDEGKARTVSGLLSAVTGLIKAIMPDPNAVKAFTNTVEEKGVFTKTKWQNLDVKGMTNFMYAYATKLKDLIPALTSGIIIDVANAVQNIDKDKLAKMSAVGDILKVVVDMVKVIGEAGKSTSTSNAEFDLGEVKNLEKTIVQGANIPLVMQGIANMIGPLMNSLKSVVDQMPADKAFMKNLDTAKTLFGFLGEIPKLVTSMADVAKTTGTDIGNTDPLIKAVSSIALFLGRLTGGAAFGTSKAPLMELLDNITSIANVLGAGDAKSKTMKVVQDVKGFFESLPKIMIAMRSISELKGVDSKMFGDVVGKLAESMTSMKDPMKKIVGSLNDETLKGVTDAAGRVERFAKGMEKINDSITNHGVKQVLAAVGEMIDKTQKLDEALAKSPDFNVNARLTKLATGMGLGGRYAYSVKSKEVIINLNLNVSMNVDEVEKVMIMRKSSIIRDRINFATGDGAGEKGKPDIPETYSAVLPNITKSGG